MPHVQLDEVATALDDQQGGVLDLDSAETTLYAVLDAGALPGAPPTHGGCRERLRRRLAVWMLHGVTELETKRWRRYGKDRVYVATLAGERVGWLDLLDGSRHLEAPEHAAAFEAALQPFATESAEVQVPEQRLPAAPVEALAPEWHDLAQNRPGEQVREEAGRQLAAMLDRSRVSTFLLRAFDVKTDERAFRVGAKGEEAIGARLDKLEERGWHVLHSIPVGKGNSDIDHLLIGPGGAYTINTKNHPDKQVWVGQYAIRVGGHSTRYLPIARYEAERAERLLSAAVGFPVPVRAVLVILTGTVIPQVTIKQMPEDVLVLDRMDVPRVFKRAPTRLTPGEVAAVYEQARRSSLWTSA